MTAIIRIGPIANFRVCFATEADITANSGPPRALCMDGGARFQPGLTTYTRNPAKVTCTECIEWMHA